MIFDVVFAPALNLGDPGESSQISAGRNYQLVAEPGTAVVGLSCGVQKLTLRACSRLIHEASALLGACSSTFSSSDLCSRQIKNFL